ncbi:hypothetical protein BP6252_02030 [Coleophoma cylindrospora]|uniref:Uncharacterized protein n=1 Tax=Coleophoma cylindrospora TaxID=1849047 RepID=A0A3D8SDN3_9HELO|nr:hypothetical protein BP6252_02030 [Coleophoma cylindrospora]
MEMRKQSAKREKTPGGLSYGTATVACFPSSRDGSRGATAVRTGHALASWLVVLASPIWTAGVSVASVPDTRCGMGYQTTHRFLSPTAS